MPYDLDTTEEKLRLIRHHALIARKVLWEIDDGYTSDGRPYKSSPAMHPSVAKLQSELDDVIVTSAYMIDEIKVPE